jgi:hypothetical protein
MAERPEYLTVPEVMARLRLGRTTVYEQAHLYLATNGAEGLPCRRFGRSLRFPAAAFDASVGDGVTRSTTDVVDLPASHTRQMPAPPEQPQPRTASPRRRPLTTRGAAAAQLSLLSPDG